MLPQCQKATIPSSAKNCPLPHFSPPTSSLSLQNWWTTNFLIYREAQKEIKTGKKEDQERPEKTDPDEDDMEEILQSKGNPLLMLIKAASIQNPKQFQLPAEVMTHAPLPGTLFFLMKYCFQPAVWVQSPEVFTAPIKYHSHSGSNMITHPFIANLSVSEMFPSFFLPSCA